MKVLAVLWTVCLVRLSYCGGDGGKGGLKEAEKQTPSTHAQNQPQEQQKEQNLQPIPQGVQGKPAAPVTKSAGQRVTLDLSKPDETKVDIVKASKNGVEKKTYYPKKGNPILHQVVDDQSSIWSASGREIYVFVQSHTKGNSSILAIYADVGSFKYKKEYFEKTADGWVSIDKEDYDKKFVEMGCPKRSRIKKLLGSY
ncbi:signal peptide-containing protein [Theileria equi strain WA]|uniref:Signal peptide-containing protein n=1 Tax=Theileria equi strain WA TaxID=1537102 RepID=L0B0X4_THEEQ|nr:signal peptide-containing protein [Theileria equi strain WA]AFZ80881.1 signal peptide-containing protein [Theileria equi strain WA]|eukprot:XP_004830547.1 signal peptide-containing protein [Theileria equi strain WA]